RDDGFGDVLPLVPGQNFTLGRAATNNVVLKDDRCSRDHAEISFSAGRWRVRDLGSLNGTWVNDARVEGARELAPGDELVVGRSGFLSVEDMDQLPDRPSDGPPAEGGMAIRKRLGQTRFLTPQPPSTPEEETLSGEAAVRSHSLSRDLSLLYRLALDMGLAG